MITQIEQTNNLAVAKQKSPTTLNDLRQAAQQFEAILLNQLTSTLNGTGEPDEDALFGGDGGTGLAKQMFSEQLANTMAKSGGVGLADMIMQKFGVNQSKSLDNKINPLTKTISAVKDIRENPAKEASIKSTNDGEVTPKVENNVVSPNLDNSVNIFTPDENALNATRPRSVASHEP